MWLSHGMRGPGIPGSEEAQEALVVRLPDGDAVAAVSELQAAQPGARFAMLTAGAADEVLVRAIEAGACGFFEKSENLPALCSAVRAAHRVRP